jgi:hypothetical protein
MTRLLYLQWAILKIQFNFWVFADTILNLDKLNCDCLFVAEVFSKKSLHLPEFRELSAGFARGRSE